MSIQWSVSEPIIDRFEAAAGKRVEYTVHSAESPALFKADIERAVDEVLCRALLNAPSAVTVKTARMLILWDPVYSMLTIVYCDHSMMDDNANVTNCQFSELDRVSFDNRFSASSNDDDGPPLESDFQSIVRRSVERADLEVLPSAMPIFFSDQDRTVGAEDFVAVLLMKR